MRVNQGKLTWTRSHPRYLKPAGTVRLTPNTKGVDGDEAGGPAIRTLGSVVVGMVIVRQVPKSRSGKHVQVRNPCSNLAA